MAGGTCWRTVRSWLRSLVPKPLEHPIRVRLLDCRAEAKLIALAYAPAPGGRRTWAMQCLTGHVVGLYTVRAIYDRMDRCCLQRFTLGQRPRVMVMEP